MFARADFAAAFAQWEDLAGVEGGIGSKGVVNAAHEVEISVGEEERHELGFFHANAVFAGERAADFDAVADDFGGGFEGAFELSSVTGIEKDDWVEIAVASVENIADLKAVLIADFADTAKGLGKFRTGDYAVENVIARSQTTKRAERVFAAFPEEIAFGGIAGEADFAGVMRVANFDDGERLRGDGFGEAFDFDQEDGGAVHGKTGMDVVLDGAQRPTIEHLASGGSNGAGGDVGNGFSSVVNRIKNCEQRFHGFRLARKFYGDFGDESERAFRADEKTSEVIARRVTVFAADADDFAVGKNEF